MLKTDLHLHSGEDAFHKLGYTAKDLIEYAAKLEFEVLAFTFHRDVFFYKELSDYAKKKGILLISGVERYIEGKEVLLYNVSQSDIEKIKTFDDLRIFKKKKNILVIAPHPFFKRSNCLGKKLLENIDVFDAIEYSHFYLSFFNLNKMAVKIAKKHKLTLIGNSDTHYLKQIEMTYSLIDSKKSIDSIFKAIKKGNVILKTKPISLKYFFWRIFRIIMKSE